MGEPEAALVDKDNDSEFKSKASVLSNPDVMAALQNRLNTMVGGSSGYIESLPFEVKQRINALKTIQLEAIETETKFHDEIFKLECKYHELFKPLYLKRSLITKGEVEPSAEECVWPNCEGELKGEEAAMDNGLNSGNSTTETDVVVDMDKIDGTPTTDPVVGIPEFWLTIFKNVDQIHDMLHGDDFEALKSLTDIELEMKTDLPIGFTLKFHFSPNEYFYDSVLTKHYEMKCEILKSDPFSFEGPEIVRAQGCCINWKKGKNLTVKSVKKKQKHKSKGSVRTVMKQVKADSFFNFFAPPVVPDDDSEVDSEIRELLTADFELGHYIRERIIPRAVLYFTGEAVEDDDYSDEEEDEEEEDEENCEDEEDDPDFDPSEVKSGQTKQDCKQQ